MKGDKYKADHYMRGLNCQSRVTNSWNYLSAKKTLELVGKYKFKEKYTELNRSYKV